MCHYVTAWQHAAPGTYNLVYCLSFANTWGFSLAYGIRDVPGGLPSPSPQDREPQLPGSWGEHTHFPAHAMP